MAVKHVTIYECDVCKVHVDSKGLTAVKIGTIALDTCSKCLLKVEIAVGIASSDEETAEPLEQPHHTR